MAAPPLLVFDLDGTLVDTAGDLIGALNNILSEESIAAGSARDGAADAGGRRACLDRARLIRRRPAASRASGSRRCIARLPGPLRSSYRRREPRLSGRRAAPWIASSGGVGVSRSAPTRSSIPPFAAARPNSARPSVSGRSAAKTRSRSEARTARACRRRSRRLAAIRRGRSWSGDSKTDIADRAGAARARCRRRFRLYRPAPVASSRRIAVIWHFDDLRDAVQSLAVIASRDGA